MKKIATVLFFILVCSSLSPLFADWPCRTDTGVAICTIPGNQWNAHIASDGSNGAFILWQDRRGGLEDKLYLQRVNNSGVPQWTNGGIPLAVTGGYQYYPQMISDGAGGVYIAWQDNRSATDYNIYVQHVSSAGVPLWTQNGTVVCYAAGDQYNPQLVIDGLGGVLVTWQDHRNGTDYDIYCQHFNASGQPLWQANGVPICASSGDQVMPVIATDGQSGAIIAWTDYRAGSGFSDVYAQRVLANGQRVWPTDGAAVCSATNTQWNVQVVADGIGSAFVVWQDRRLGTYDNIYAQLINNAGQPQWTTDGIPLAPVIGVQYYPQAVSDGAGGVVVVWQDNRKGADYDIYGQRVNHSGQLLWLGSGQPICDTIGHQYNPQVIFQNSTVIVTWQDHRNGTDYDIYCQALTLNGSIKWTSEGVAVSSATLDQYEPVLATDNQSGAIISWVDYHTSINNTDIFSQRIGANGKPAGGCYRTISQYGYALKGIRTYNRVLKTVYMPNEGNVRDSLFKRGVFAGGLYLGYSRMDAPRSYAWEIYTASLYVRYALPQNGTPRPLNQIYDRPLYGVLRNASVNRYNNKVTGELLALKLNIAASDLRITEPNLGELVYKDPTSSSNPLNNHTLRQVAAFTDSALTYWKFYVNKLDYVKLAYSLSTINAAFSAQLDTVSLSPLKLTTVLPLYSIPFLAANPDPPPFIPLFQPMADPEDQIPQSFGLSQNYPNPFNPVTTIEFAIPEQSYVTLKIYNTLGQEIATLLDHRLSDPGRQIMDFNASTLASGVYFYQLTAEKVSGGVSAQTKKMLLLK
jgi:hypothetical protein